ncbi:putative branched-subunit amino acid permease [Diaminobutyricimonas aerilata]|uniref:Putative branched-subunit amino acid permease n=1 Tax=Diaminobutyricimonas aerilata TaxID=1162967 RepID=A0A2M9CL77_9MICO|nr:AzlC family ABC transporter permease [Diaminobutyricimonas aerilata]PJJ72619.1 putative branched-subunit amino acid permease [Diaminobutyricimonas aerilata]
MPSDASTPLSGWRAGFRVGIGLAIGAFALAVSFGAFAVTNGWPAWLAIVMSAVTFSGSAQFALVTAASGGGLVAGIGAAALINARFIPMAAASARWLHGGPVRRAFEGQAVVDGSWVAAQNGDGSLDRRKMFGATLVQWPAWTLGTAIGALFAPSTAFMRDFGLDVIFPAFFLVLLLDALRARPRFVPIALAAAGIGAVAAFVLPSGVALLLCALSAVLAAVRTAKGSER